MAVQDGDCDGLISRIAEGSNPSAATILRLEVDQLAQAIHASLPCSSEAAVPPVLVDVDPQVSLSIAARLATGPCLVGLLVAVV